MATAEVDVLWITAGLGCDGDTIAMTAATQPSLEELVNGALPGVPRLRLHNPVLSRQNGDAFMEPFHLASRALRNFTKVSLEKEPEWRTAGRASASGRRDPGVPE